MEMVTVGLVTYNRCKLVGRAIKSVLSQTYGNLQLIVSDDNSSDDTAAVVAAFVQQDPRVQYVQHSGIGMTNNFVEVLKLARGRYFMWLCDDDYIEADYIEKTLHFLANHEDYSLACGVTRFFTQAGILSRFEYMHLEAESPVERISTYYRQVNSNIILYGLMRREQIASFLYPDTFGADLLWSCQLVFSGKVKILQDTFFYYSVEGISQQTDSLKNYYKTTRLKKRNPYLELRKELYRLVKRGEVFEKIGYVSRALLAARLWIIIRERFCMPAAEARVRSALALRTRFKRVFR